MSLATILPAIAYLPSTLGFAATPDELGEMLRIVLCLSLIVGGGSIAVACVDGFVAADRSRERAGVRTLFAYRRAPFCDHPFFDVERKMTMSSHSRDTVRDTKSSTRKFGEDAIDSAEEALESTRAFANDSLGRVSEKVRDLRRDLEPAMDHLRYRARRAARRGMDAADQARERTKETVNHYADVTGQYVSDQPVRSILIAVAAGAALAALILAARNNRRD